MWPKTALLVIDMQVAFTSMAETALPNVLRLCEYFSQVSSPIVFTQHGHTEAELTTHPSPNQLVNKWSPSGSIAVGSSSWEMLEELKDYVPRPATEHPPLSVGHSFPNATSSKFPKLVPKNTYDAFINTSLSTVLEAADIKRVVVCGVMTDCCVDTTARSAFNRGYETWLVKDASGSANRRQHEAGLRGFGFAFGPVVSTDEVLKSLEEERAAEEEE
jgi:nicotinamidase-related amidase